MGRHKDCYSAAARQNSCCHDTYFIRSGLCIVFLNCVTLRLFNPPRQTLNVEAKVVGKLIKVRRMEKLNVVK